MGRRNISGVQPLPLEFTKILAELLKECLETRRAIDTGSGETAYPTVTKCVECVAIPQFCNKRGSTTTPEENKQIQHWYKNQCSKHNVSLKRKRCADEEQEVVELQVELLDTKSSDKLPSIRSLVIETYKDEITDTLKQISWRSSAEYLKEWNQAISDKVKNLSEEELQDIET